MRARAVLSKIIFACATKRRLVVARFGSIGLLMTGFGGRVGFGSRVAVLRWDITRGSTAVIGRHFVG